MTHGGHAEALSDFNKALALDPNTAVVWNNRGLIYLSRQDYQVAEQQFAKSVECDSKYADGGSDHLIPAPIPSTIAVEVRAAALAANEAGQAGSGHVRFSRIDPTQSEFCRCME